MLMRGVNEDEFDDLVAWCGREGFDLVFISGGKAIRGPQSAGLLMGKRSIIEAARLSAPPRGFNVGRAHKVNKEEKRGSVFCYDCLQNKINASNIANEL